jgi:hypothetical protein
MNQASSTTTLQLTFPRDQAVRFFPLFQQGIRLKVMVGCNLKQFLGEQLGLAPDYLEERVQTLFLDGKVVDDLENAFIRDGSAIALSAALPGLAGATLRRGGPVASMRSQITYGVAEKTGEQGEGMVVVKLFNLLLNELAPFLLERGLYILRKDGEDFLRSLPQEFWRGCRKIEVDGKEVNFKTIMGVQGLSNHRWVFFSIHFSPSP